jgi:hypothetical protein
MMHTMVSRGTSKTIRLEFTEARDHDMYNVMHLSQEQAEKLCDSLTGLLQDMITEDETRT